MANDELSQVLEQGIDAAKRGDRATGRRLLEQVIESEPANELAWIWLASCVGTLKERQECLERVLEINPDNARAKQALNALMGQQPKGDNSAINRDTMSQLRGGREGRAQQTTQSKPTQTADGEDKPSGNNEWLGIVAVLGALIVAGILIVTQLPNLTSTTVTATNTPPIAVAQPVVTVVQNTPMPQLPTLPPPTFDGTNRAPTLPPTFTPTASPTLTATPSPTTTPYPLTEFTLYYVGLPLDAVAPALYRGVGDASDLTLVGDDFREIAIDPSGQFLAFVRDVPVGEGGESYPQLHIAPINNLTQAQAITDFRGTILSNPSWSPNAQELVFVTNNDGDEDIWYTATDGTGQYALTDNPYADTDPDWSPIANSRQLVFASDRESVGSPELYLMDIPQPNTTNEAIRLTNADKSSYAPTWNATGTHIVFVSDRNTDADIFLFDIANNVTTLLTVDDNNAEDRAPTFTTDGRYVAFISNRIGDEFAIYLTTYNGRELIPLGASLPAPAIQMLYLPQLIYRLR
ncbi:MAG: hypothetical protein SH821_17900 [Phototrophicales bacterium]|nr:hypothetical protein [Phototrophicales bacterium]